MGSVGALVPPRLGLGASGGDLRQAFPTRAEEVVRPGDPSTLVLHEPSELGVSELGPSKPGSSLAGITPPLSVHCRLRDYLGAPPTPPHPGSPALGHKRTQGHTLLQRRIRGVVPVKGKRRSLSLPLALRALLETQHFGHFCS